MFKVKLVKFEKAIAMQVLEMDESLRSTGLLFTASNGVEVKSQEWTDLSSDGIWLRGRYNGMDLMINRKTFDSNSERDTYFDKMVVALKEYKESFKKEGMLVNDDVVII